MRIRSIKPEFWRSDDVNELTIEDRLLFIGLWSYVDDNGVGIDRFSNICADLFAHDLSVSPHDTLTRVQDGLNRLQSQGVIVRYSVGSKDYLEIANWEKHQRINRPSPGRYPRSGGEGAEIQDALIEDSVRAHEASLPGTGEQGSSGTEDQRKGGAGGSRKRHSTQLPKGWKPNESHVENAHQLGLEIDHETQQFRSHHLAKGSTFKNWDQAFNNWLGKSKSFKTNSTSNPQTDLWNREGPF